MHTEQPPTYEELAREVLLRRMREYSEDCHCASWLIGLEFLLWEKQADTDKSPPTQERSKICGKLHALAKIAGGWWVYKDETQPDQTGPVFVPMERWLQILNKQNERHSR